MGMKRTNGGRKFLWREKILLKALLMLERNYRGVYSKNYYRGTYCKNIYNYILKIAYPEHLMIL